MFKDKGLLGMFAFISMVFAIAMLIKGVSVWWIAGFAALFFYGSLVTELNYHFEEEPNNHTDDESHNWPKDWEDYKAGYEAPDEYNLPEDDNHCNKCGYLVCVCKPIVN